MTGDTNAMFESLGNALPAHWLNTPLYAVASCNDEVLAETTDPDHEIRYVEISDVSADRGITDATKVRFGEAPSRARRKVQKGDVLLSTVRTYLRAVAAVDEAYDDVIASTGFAVIRPRKIHPGYLRYVVLSDHFINEVIARSVGVSYPAINASDVMKLKIPKPPLEEQRRIAAFLDHETARIDELVREQERLVQLVREKLNAYIYARVVLGKHALPELPRDAGQRWYERAPQAWKRIPLRYAAVSRCDGPFGASLKSEHYADSGTRVIRLQNIRERRFDDTDAAFIDNDYARGLKHHEVMRGDLLIAGLGDENNPVGRACTAPEGISPAIVKADCFRFRLKPSVTLPDFAAIQLSATAVEDGGALAIGSTRSRVSLSRMSGRFLVLPSLEEQKTIVDSIQELEREMALVSATAHEAIRLLVERRSSLISAAVTGQLDLRNWHPPGPEAVAEVA